MSESDTTFNEGDRRCAAVQLMLSTDPSYDNRTSKYKNHYTRLTILPLSHLDDLCYLGNYDALFISFRLLTFLRYRIPECPIR